MMRFIACLRASTLAARRAAGLSEAERLTLERHLAACSRCVSDRERIDRVCELVAAIPTPPGSRVRAIARALEHRAHASEASVERRRLVPWPAALLAIAVAGALAMLTITMTSRPAPRGVAQPQAPVARAPVALVPPDAGSAAVPEIVADVEGIAREQRTLDLGRARVTLEPGARFRWSRGRATFELTGGQAVFDVDPGHEPFRVTTERFEVEVLGTRFTVRPDGLSVERGTVRVLAHDGRILAAAVTAGHAWALAPPRSSVHAPQPDVDALLARARSALARGDVTSARAELARAAALHLSPVQAAGAGDLLAETALADGDTALAERRYLEVARTYPSLAAGENALFAAARVDERAGRATPAIRLYHEYLDRYPAGRFHDEVATHLHSLEVSP